MAFLFYVLYLTHTARATFPKSPKVYIWVYMFTYEYEIELVLPVKIINVNKYEIIKMLHKNHGEALAMQVLLHSLPCNHTQYPCRYTHLNVYGEISGFVCNHTQTMCNHTQKLCMITQQKGNRSYTRLKRVTIHGKRVTIHIFLVECNVTGGGRNYEMYIDVGISNMNDLKRK